MEYSSHPRTPEPLSSSLLNNQGSWSQANLFYAQWAEMQFTQYILHYWCLNPINGEYESIKIALHFESHYNSLIV